MANMPAIPKTKAGDNYGGIDQKDTGSQVKSEAVDNLPYDIDRRCWRSFSNPIPVPIKNPEEGERRMSTESL